MAAGETGRVRGAAGCALGGGARSPSRLICGATHSCERCHSNTFSSRLRLLLSRAFNSSLVGCTARARFGDDESILLGLTGLGGGAVGAFLFLAEQTEQDSSEQLLADEPDGDDFLGGGDGGRLGLAGGAGLRRDGTGAARGERRRGLGTGLRPRGLRLGERRGLRRADLERDLRGERLDIGDRDRLGKGVRDLRPNGVLDLRATGDLDRLGDGDLDPSRYNCL